MSKLKNFQETFGKCPTALLNDNNISLDAKGLYTILESKCKNPNFDLDLEPLNFLVNKTEFLELLENKWVKIENKKIIINYKADN